MLGTHEVRRAERAQIAEPHTIRVVVAQRGGDFDGQASLATAAWPSQGEQADAGPQPVLYVGEQTTTADKRRWLPRQSALRCQVAVSGHGV
jgi:hypothetical protein